MKMYGYIYLIVNKIDGKTYVGKRKLYKKSWNEDGYMGSGKYLKPAQKKYGIENFEKFLITWTYSEEDACEKEKFWIAEYRRRGKAEYNISNGGDGGFLNEELNKKRSETQKGRHLSEEHKKKISEAHKGKTSGMKGKHQSDEAKRKLSVNNIRYWKGKCLSEECKKRISEAQKLRWAKRKSNK